VALVSSQIRESNGCQKKVDRISWRLWRLQVRRARLVKCLSYFTRKPFPSRERFWSLQLAWCYFGDARTLAAIGRRHRSDESWIFSGMGLNGAKRCPATD